MTDEDSSRSFAAVSSPPVHWNGPGLTHVYPHSHHGTPAQEYSGFTFSSPQMQSSESPSFHTSLQTRQYPQLQPLVMPQWPSMLNHMSPPTYQPSIFAPPVQPIQPLPSTSPSAAVQTPASSAPPSSTRAASTPRRTLTDKDRKEMCLYAEEHPNSKQTEIGALFGVERSTVSKVLRHKEKYLFQGEEDNKSPAKKQKPRAPDIERALAVWVKNQEKKGVPITDELICDKARRFAATTSMPDNHQVLSTSWLEKFKLRHNLMGARSRKSSLALDDVDTTAVSNSHSPVEPSPPSTHFPLNSPARPALPYSRSDDGFRNTHAANQGDRPLIHHSQSGGSLGGTFYESNNISPSSPVLFTPDSGSGASPYLHDRSIFSALPPSSGSHRPRSQTFPLLDQYMDISSVPAQPQYTLDGMDSPMEEAPGPLLNMNQAMNGGDRAGGDSATMQAMRPPPLPAHLTGANTKPHATRPPPTVEEAWQAMEIVWEYFNQQPSHFLDVDETAYLVRIMEKVRLRSHSATRF